MNFLRYINDSFPLRYIYISSITIFRFPSLKANLSSFYPALIDACTLVKDGVEEVIETHSETLKKYYMYNGECINSCLEFFLQHGLSKERLNEDGETILHEAAKVTIDEPEHVFHLRCLLDLGYHVNMLNSKGQTALHVAIQAGSIFHAFYLIYRGADVNIADHHGKTALDYANELLADDRWGSQDVQKYIQDLIQVLKDYDESLLKTGIYKLLGSNDDTGIVDYRDGLFFFLGKVCF